MATSRPRLSLLDLFDPLLAEAVRVPIPDSPPSTPHTSFKSPNHGSDKENVAPEDLTMSAFFNRISRTQKFKARIDHANTLGLLVDVTDSGVAAELQEEQTPRSSRKPLAEISIEDLAPSVAPDPMIGSTPKKSVSPNRVQAAKMSSNRTSQQTTYPFPVISIIDSAQQNLSHHSIRGHGVSPALPKDLQRRREPTSSPRGYLKPPTTSSTNYIGTQHPRSPSLETSMSLSSMSLCSFHLPDASFDLVNGEISFLSNSSLEDENVNQEDVSEKPVRETPMIELPLQGMILDESPLGSLDASYLTTSGNWEKGSSPSLLATTPSDQYLAFEGMPSEAINPELNLGSRASPVNPEGQETPLKTRRISSVPAPTKKLRVFTSGHRPAAKTHIAVALPPDLELKKERTWETSEEMGGPNIIPRGARRIPTAGHAIQHTEASIKPKKPISGSHTATNNTVAPAPVQPPGTSMLRKPSTIPHIQRANTLGTATSKLAGLESSRDSMLPKLASVSKLPAPSQRVPKKISARPVSRVNLASSGRVSKA